jgi:hypothetical protein
MKIDTEGMKDEIVRAKASGNARRLGELRDGLQVLMERALTAMPKDLRSLRRLKELEALITSS